jgi:hypothetical protein
MRHGIVLLAAGLAASGMSASPARGAEPSRFAVMGVRLYMSAQEVLTSLYAQGVREDAVTEHVHPCTLHASAACTDTITAKLPDGPLTVRFTDAPPGFNDGREAAFGITYTLMRRGPGSVQEVRASAEERFGPLADEAHSAWCARVAAEGCAADQPRMSFEQSADGRSVLALTDAALPARLAPTLR